MSQNDSNRIATAPIGVATNSKKLKKKRNSIFSRPFSSSSSAKFDQNRKRLLTNELKSSTSEPEQVVPNNVSPISSSYSSSSFNRSDANYESALNSSLNKLDLQTCKPSKLFERLTFNEQSTAVSNWFKGLDDEKKNKFLCKLLDDVGNMQKQLLLSKLDACGNEETIESNCSDIISSLPHHITFKILSYLDFKSLCTVSKVCKSWYNLSNDPLLWKKFCFYSQWRFSSASETKQLEKFPSIDNENLVNWKAIFSERYRVKRNWLTGRSHVRTFLGHEGAVSCVQFDEIRIVAGSTDGSIKVWNLNSQSPYYSLNLFGHSNTIRCLHLDGKLNRLVSGSADHTIKVWDLTHLHQTWSKVTCKMTFLGHTDTVRCLQVNSDKLISGSYDHTLKIWDLKTGICKNTLRGHTDAVICLQFNDERILSGSADKSLRIWNFDGQCIRILQGHTGSITCLHFDSQRIISGSLDFDIKFWSIETGECINTLNWITKEGHTGVIRCLQADNQKIVSCSDDKTIKIWNIETGERYVTLRNHTDGVTCLQINDYFILSGSYDRTIKLWDFSI